MELAERGARHARALAAAHHGDAHEVGEVARVRAARLGRRRCRARRRSPGAFTSFTSSSVCPSSTPRSTCTVRSRVSRSAMRPRYSTSTASTEGRSAMRAGDPAEVACQRQERPERLEVLGRDRGDVHRARDHAAGERGHHLLGGLVAGAVGGLGGGGAEVRGDHHVGIAEQRVLGDGLLAEHVERGAGDLARSRAPRAAPPRPSACRAPR